MSAASGIAVSLTPLPLAADSRAFRIARSLAEAGWRSIVVEGSPSAGRFWGDEIEVVSPGAAPAPAVADTQPAPPSLAPPSLARRAGRRLRAGALGGLGELALYAGYRGYEWWQHGRRLRPLVPAAELYYLHSFELHRAVAPLARQCGARIIYDAHDFYRGIVPAALLSAFDRDRLRPFLDRLEARLAAAADALVTVSDGVAGLIETALGRRPVVIRNCHDERLDRAVAPDLRGALGLAPTARLCVVVGNCKPGMALGAAAEALALLPPDIHLAFLGRGYEAAAAALGGHAAAARLHFGHCVAPNEVVPAIRSADLGLVIYEAWSENYRYALPNGFFQVVAAGLPVVRGALPEIERAIGGRDIGACVERLEPAALAAAIQDCLARAPTLRRESAELAGELSWSNEAARLRDLVAGVRSRPQAA